MRLTHLADYAVVLMTAAARRPAGERLSATFREGRIAQQNYEAGKAKYRTRDYAAAVPRRCG